MSPKEAGDKLQELFIEQGSVFLNKTAVEMADEVGCSDGTVRNTQLWKRNMKASGRGRARRDKGAKPPKLIQAVHLSPEVEAQAGEGDRHAIVKKLIAQQAADKEADDTGKNQKKL